jgi:hypothetical protein
VRGTSPGVLEVESTRYPFCFYGSPRDPRSTRGILPFVPFQEELNRYTLVVRGLPETRARIRWNGTAQTFTRDRLARGINLAAEFPENPFSRPFNRLLQAVARKQQLETRIIKGGLRLTPLRMFNIPWPPLDGEREEARRLLLARRGEHVREVREAVRPVRHRIEIIPLPGGP